MSDFSFSYSIDGQTPTTTATEPLWSFNSVKVLPCSGNTVTLHNTRTGQGMLVQGEVAHALSLCAPFRSLNGHLEHIFDAMPPLRESPEDARNILNGIRDAGFMESSEAAWQRITGNTRASQIGSARVFILTCDRPAALKRLLSNLAELDLDAAIESVWVIDDSKNTASLEDNAEIISTIASSLPLPIHHVDATLQQKLLDHLSRSVPQHTSSIDFLLSAGEWPTSATYGRARNLALLLSVGYRSLVLDDDIVLQAIAPPTASRGLSLGTAGDRQAKFYEGHDALMQHALDVGQDPLSLMLKHVGQTLGNLASSELSGPEALAGWDGGILSRHSATSPLLLSQCGSWGDPGTADGSWIFFLPSPSVTELLASGHKISSLLNARSSWLGYRGPTLSAYGTISQLTGMDHRTLLPPYFPAGRGEDVFFGILLQRLQPESLVLSEGWAIRHEPLEARLERAALNSISVSPGLNMLADWLGREPEGQWGLTPKRRLQAVSDEVRTLCEMDTSSLEQLAGSQLASKRNSLLARCMGHLEQLQALDGSTNAELWSQFLTSTQNNLIEALQTPEVTAIDTALAQRDQVDWESIRTMGNRLADSLAAWPEICEAARGFSTE